MEDGETHISIEKTLERYLIHLGYEVCFVDEKSIFGQGKLYLVDEESPIHVSAIRVEDDLIRQNVVKNFLHTRCNPLILHFENCDANRKIILTERFDKTLKDLVADTPESVQKFWEQIPDTNTWRFSHFFKQTIQNTVYGIDYLADKKIYTRISSGGIALVGEDHESKILDLNDNFGGTSNKFQMFKDLYCLIKDVMTTHKVGHDKGYYQASKEVDHFMRLLRATKLDIVKIKKSPALKKDGERLKFVMNVLKLYLLGELTLKEVEANAPYELVNWLFRLKQYKHFGRVVQYGRDVNNKSYAKSLLDLMFCLRNSKKHLNQHVYEGGDDGLPLSPLSNKGNTVYNKFEIERAFEVLFPTLATHLLEFIPSEQLP